MNEAEPISVFDNTRGAFVRGAFQQAANGVLRARLAAPYFTNVELLNELCIGNRDLEFEIITTLQSATSAAALASAFKLPRTKLRYFTSRTFHSKLYIFGDKEALVGSANLTDAGVNSNREIIIRIPSQITDTFDRLVSLFEAYWAQAVPLSQGVIDRFDAIKTAAVGLNAASA
jgi:phosphatidylserine/phosphatidylglycerophosphate/cardiolipin synthase-like enzyme